MLRLLTATVASFVIFLALGCTKSSANNPQAQSGGKREVKEPRDPPSPTMGIERQGAERDEN